MAKQSNNVVTHGMSGKIGDLLVFRQVGGKTVIANATPDRVGYLWIYTATSTNDSLDGDRIEITVSDLPGNVTQDTVTVGN